MQAMGANPGRAADKTELREEPAYGLTQAARYLKLPAPTLRSWVARTDPPVPPPLEYNPQAAKLAWKRTMEFFDQRIRK